MKILFRHEKMASHFIYMGIGLALKNLGHDFIFWDDSKNSAFDIFSMVEPDIYLGQGYNLTRAEIKCINNRPDMKVVLKVGIWGNILNEPNLDKYEMLIASDKEKLDISSIVNPHRLFLFNYHTEKYNDYILGKWKNAGYNTFPLPPMGDSYNFYPDYNNKVSGDICFVGGYWSYKSINLNKFILPLCHPIGKYNIKIFGNQHWPCPQYCGMVDDRLVRQIYSSAKITPCVHEPQCTDFGFEILSRLYNPILCKSLVISDYVESINDLFPNGEIPMFKDPKEYHNCIDYYLSHENERLELVEKQYNKVINNYTYNHLIPKVLDIIK